MRFHSFEMNTGAPVKKFVFEKERNVTVLRGENVELTMSLMGAMIGSFERCDIIEGSRDPLFVLHGRIEAHDKDFTVCYICTKNEPHLIGAERGGYGQNISKEDTQLYQRTLRAHGTDGANVFTYVPTLNETLPESKAVLAQFCRFLTDAEEATRHGDCRPLFIYGLFDRLDEAEDVQPLLNRLGNMSRQAFLNVGPSYPAEKLSHPFVTVLDTAA